MRTLLDGVLIQVSLVQNQNKATVPVMGWDVLGMFKREALLHISLSEGGFVLIVAKDWMQVGVETVWITKR
eukprot:1145798-Pelagomonas_calceolata.AAC.2